MTALPTRADIERVAGAVAAQAAVTKGKYNHPRSAAELEESWKKCHRLIENILKEAFLK